MDHIIYLYKENGGAEYKGAPVTQYQYAMQCYLCAEEFLKENEKSFDFKRVSPYEIKLGAFLHDVGYLLEFCNIKKEEFTGLNRERKGAKYLKELGFSDNICSLVENHMNTKRYLMTKDIRYYSNLSLESKKIFENIGGKMNVDEIYKFEKDKLFFWHLFLGTWVDKSKSIDHDLLEYINNYDVKKIFYKI